MAEGRNDRQSTSAEWPTAPAANGPRWTRIALLATALATVGLAAAELVVTLRHLGVPH